MCELFFTKALWKHAGVLAARCSLIAHFFHRDLTKRARDRVILKAQALASAAYHNAYRHNTLDCDALCSDMAQDGSCRSQLVGAFIICFDMHVYYALTILG